MTPLPRLLIVETSGRVGHVAVAEGSQLCGRRRLDEARRHARDLAPCVAELLQEQGWKPRDLQGIIVSRGPGSYTGLRVGIASAQALAYVTGCVLIAVDTFAAIAWQAPPEASTLNVIADAQQDRVYVQKFGFSLDGWQAETDLEIIPLAQLELLDAESCWVTGPGLQRHGQRLSQRFRLVAGDRWDPQVESLLAIGLARHQRGEHDDLGRLEPLYARPSAAEQQWQDRPHS